MNKTIILSIFLFATISATAAEVDPFAPFEVSYKVLKSGGEVARIQNSLKQQADGSYIYHSETKSTGLVSVFYKLHINEQSQWRMSDGALEPLDYQYERTKKKKKSFKHTAFDWPNKQANYDGDGKPKSFAIKEGMTDKLLYQLNLMYDLQTNTAIETYTVVDGARIKKYYFENLGKETIDTALGKLETIKIVRRKSKNPEESPEKIILWCADKYNYLPIKIESTDDEGSVTTALVEKLQGFQSETLN